MISKNQHISPETEFQKGQHSSPDTEFKKGQFAGEKHPFWKGGKTLSGNGYILVYAPGHPRAYRSRVYEHIIVIEKFLGRFLRTGEVVHHLNGVKADNRLENLIILENDKKHFGCYHSGVNNKKFLRIDMTRVNKLIGKGKTIPEIAKILGVHFCTIYRRINGKQ